MGKSNNNNNRAMESQRLNDLKTNGKIDLGHNETPKTLNQEGKVVSRIRTQFFVHVPMGKVPDTWTKIMERFGKSPTDIDITLTHSSRWGNDDVEMKVVSYSNLADLGLDIKQVADNVEG